MRTAREWRRDSRAGTWVERADWRRARRGWPSGRPRGERGRHQPEPATRARASLSADGGSLKASVVRRVALSPTWGGKVNIRSFRIRPRGTSQLNIVDRFTRDRVSELFWGTLTIIMLVLVGLTFLGEHRAVDQERTLATTRAVAAVDEVVRPAMKL